MKKILSFVLSIAMLLSMTAGIDFSALAADELTSGKCGDNVSYSFDKDTGVLTISGTGGMYNYCTTTYYNTSLPGLPGSYAFPGSSSTPFGSEVKTVIVEDGVTRLGNAAFRSCSNLSEIILPDSLKYIGYKVFDGSAYYKDKANWQGNALYIDNNLISVDTSVSGTYKVKDGTKIIADSAFDFCDNITSIEFPDSVESLGQTAFFRCNNLKNIVLGSNVKYIDKYVFHCGQNPGISSLIKIDYVYLKSKVINGESLENLISSMVKGSTLYAYNSTGAKEICDKYGVHFVSLDELEHKHTYTSVVTKEATCTEEGIITYTCSECQNSYTEKIPALGHDVVIDAAVDASCTTEGKTEGSHCSRCGTVITAQETVPATGHHYVLDEKESTAASCTESGQNIYVCSTCGDKLIEAVPSLGHNYVDGVCTRCNEKEHSVHTYVKEITKAATCKEEGTAVYTCSVCGDSYSETIPKTEHDFKLTADYAGCTKEGYKIYECSVCGETKAEKSPAIGHDYVKTVVPPTCKEQGYTKYVCSRCGDTYKSDYTDKTNEHSYGEYVYNNDATCTADGTETAVCTVCGNKDTRTAAGTKKPHSYVLQMDNASCEKAGYKVYECSVCGETKAEKSPAKGHKPVDTEAVAPSCIATGLTAGTICSVCGKTLSGREVVPKSDHSYVLIPENSRKATCTETGMNYYKCSVCGESYTSTLAIIPHKYEVRQKKESTPTERGYEIFTCTECQTSYKEYLPYASDNSALLAALLKASLFSKADFSAESFEAFQKIYKACDVISDKDSSQTEIDEATAQIITAINSLVPYASVSVESEHGSVDLSYGENTYPQGSYSILFGTPVTLRAKADEGYEFAGWYETTTKRTFSNDELYTFYATSNMHFKAVFNKVASATLSFENESGWLAGSVTKTAAQWKEISSIKPFLPTVPYQLGYENGRWEYDENDVLTKLANGENVKLIAVYDKKEEETKLPDEPEEADVPTIKMSYFYDCYCDVGSFAMRAKIPEGCCVNSIGIAFRRGPRDKFNPADIYLTLNNKNLISHFTSFERDGIYVVDARGMSRYNWAAVGFVTYIDKSGNLKTVYSDQVNIVDNYRVY